MLLEVNEGFILRELVYALQGVDGKLFQKDPKDMQSIIIKVEMERSTRMLILRYLECGWLYLRLRKFLSSYNNSPSAGLILQVKTGLKLKFLEFFLKHFIFQGFLCIYIC